MHIARRIVVISESFARNLADKGVAERKIQLIYDPASRPITERPASAQRMDQPRVLTMGNIGYSQGLAPLVAAFQRADSMRERRVSLAITGDGVAAEDAGCEPHRRPVTGQPGRNPADVPG